MFPLVKSIHLKMAGMYPRSPGICPLVIQCKPSLLSVTLPKIFKFPRREGGKEGGPMHEWPGNWSCDLRANERPKKNFIPGRKQTHRQNHRQTDMATL